MFTLFTAITDLNDDRIVVSLLYVGCWIDPFLKKEGREQLLPQEHSQAKSNRLHGSFLSCMSAYLPNLTCDANLVVFS
jgi:hypothetical protein